MADTQKKLETGPYKGVRDFFPEDMWIQKHLFQIMRNTVEKFGYTEYSASILEPADLYKEKSGDEIVNEQTYTFTDRGDREVTLRPEMTPTVARMVAARRRDLGFPLRWYSIPNLFRYENPQRGRLREHYQLNVDIFGVSDMSAEVEIISIAYKIMKAYGAKDGDFAIRINSRRLLEVELKQRIRSAKLYAEAVRLIDKKDKLSPEDFATSWAKLSDQPFDGNFIPDEAVNNVLNTLIKLGITNAVFYPTLTRGFDYYTDIVFEVFDTHPENRRSLFGGGRYDNLLELFGNDNVSAVGFGMGDVTLYDFLEVHELLPAYEPETDAVLATIGDVDGIAVAQLADRLREQGIAVAVNITAKKPADAIRNALKLGVKFMIFVGEDELSKKQYTVKNLKTEEAVVVNEEDIFGIIKSS